MATENPNWVWNPYQTLDLYSLGPSFNCLAIAVSSGKRCMWTIPSTIQDEAHRTLEAMATEHPSSHAVAMKLGQLVPLLCCRQYHQRGSKQRDEKIAEWLAKIQGVAIEVEASTEVTPQTQQSREPEIAPQTQQLRQPGITSHIQQLREALSRFEDVLRQAQLQRAQQEYDRAQREARELNTRSETLASMVTELEVKLQEAQRQLGDIQNAAQEKDTEISGLKSALEAAQAETSMPSSVGSDPNAQLQEAENETVTYEVSY